MRFKQALEIRNILMEQVERCENGAYETFLGFKDELKKVAAEYGGLVEFGVKREFPTEGYEFSYEEPTTHTAKRNYSVVHKYGIIWDCGDESKAERILNSYEYAFAEWENKRKRLLKRVKNIDKMKLH